jgi:hypothetical protein
VAGGQLFCDKVVAGRVVLVGDAAHLSSHNTSAGYHHQPPFFLDLDLYWRSPESGDLWYNSRKLKQTICRCLLFCDKVVSGRVGGAAHLRRTTLARGTTPSRPPY